MLDLLNEKSNWQYLLPPANEVWNKVMFSQVFVCPQGGLCPEGVSVGISVQGGLCPGGSL